MTFELPNGRKADIIPMLYDKWRICRHEAACDVTMPLYDDVW